MVLWICIGVVIVALVALAVLVFDASGHAKRLTAAIKTVQTVTAPQIATLRSAFKPERSTNAPSQPELASAPASLTNPPRQPVRSTLDT